MTAKEKIAICKLCDDYGMTEGAMRLCIEDDKIRQPLEKAYKFADQILALEGDNWRIAVVEKQPWLPFISGGEYWHIRNETQQDILKEGWVKELSNG